MVTIIKYIKDGIEIESHKKDTKIQIIKYIITNIIYR
jgi:hypothetical protein